MKPLSRFFDDVLKVAGALTANKDIEHIVVTPLRYLAMAKMLNILRQDATGLSRVEIEQIANDYYLNEKGGDDEAPNIP